jgi:hypothetical protein
MKADPLSFIIGAVAGATLVGIVLVVRIVFCGWEAAINP